MFISSICFHGRDVPLIIGLTICFSPQAAASGATPSSKFSVSGMKIITPIFKPPMSYAMKHRDDGGEPSMTASADEPPAKAAPRRAARGRASAKSAAPSASLETGQDSEGSDASVPVSSARRASRARGAAAKADALPAVPVSAAVQLPLLQRNHFLVCCMEGCLLEDVAICCWGCFAAANAVTVACLKLLDCSF